MAGNPYRMQVAIADGICGSKIEETCSHCKNGPLIVSGAPAGGPNGDGTFDCVPNTGGLGAVCPATPPPSVPPTPVATPVVTAHPGPNPLSWSPAYHYFNPIPVGSSSGLVTFTLTNAAWSTDLNNCVPVFKWGCTGHGGDDAFNSFTIVSNTCTSSTMLSGSTCAVTVRAHPVITGILGIGLTARCENGSYIVTTTPCGSVPVGGIMVTGLPGPTPTPLPPTPTPTPMVIGGTVDLVHTGSGSSGGVVRMTVVFDQPLPFAIEYQGGFDETRISGGFNSCSSNYPNPRTYSVGNDNCGLTAWGTRSTINAGITNYVKNSLCAEPGAPYMRGTKVVFWDLVVPSGYVLRLRPTRSTLTFEVR